jgi:hypothetical protein
METLLGSCQCFKKGEREEMKPLAYGFVVSTAIRLRRLVELPALAQEKKVAHVSKSQATVVLTNHDQVFYPKCIQFCNVTIFYNVNILLVWSRSSGLCFVFHRIQRPFTQDVSSVVSPNQPVSIELRPT